MLPVRLLLLLQSKYARKKHTRTLRGVVRQVMAKRWPATAAICTLFPCFSVQGWASSNAAANGHGARASSCRASLPYRLRPPLLPRRRPPPLMPRRPLPPPPSYKHRCAGAADTGAQVLRPHRPSRKKDNDRRAASAQGLARHFFLFF